MYINIYTFFILYTETWCDYMVKSGTCVFTDESLTHFSPHGVSGVLEV